MSALVSPARLRNFRPRCDYTSLAPYIERAAQRRQINTNRRVSHWLGHVAWETGGFLEFTENLNYSTPERIMAVWPSRFLTVEDAQPYVHNPQALANRVYGGRMGNHGPDDGWRYIGRGGLHRTGLDGYQAAQLALNARNVNAVAAPDLLERPELLAASRYAFEDAADFWADHGLNEAADANDISRETQTISGGLGSLTDRKLMIGRARAVWFDAA